MVTFATIILKMLENSKKIETDLTRTRKLKELKAGKDIYENDFVPLAWRAKWTTIKQAKAG